jgi:drug/metabolite transporter (DMT)-like permease
MLLVAMSASGFATQALFVKILGRTGFGSFEIVLARGSFQTFGMSMMLNYHRVPLRDWFGREASECWCLTAAAFFGFFGIACSFFALQFTTLANGQVASQTTPI